MASSYKAEQRTGTLAQALSDAASDLSGLRDEMRDWADNMEGNNMGHLDKCQEARDCADLLDCADQLPSDPPDAVKDAALTWSDSVNRRKGRGESRAVRRDNAVARLRAVIEHCDEWLEENEDDGNNPVPDGYDDVEAFRDEVQSVADEVEGAEFPGMY